jgi:hypothetical protein
MSHWQSTSIYSKAVHVLESAQTRAQITDMCKDEVVPVYAMMTHGRVKHSKSQHQIATALSVLFAEAGPN